MTSKPDFSEFEDWLIDHPAANWSGQWSIGALNIVQKQIVERNALLLRDQKLWQRKSKAFEAELNKINNQKTRENQRAKFAIRLDQQEFVGDRDTDFSNYHFPCSTSFISATFSGGNVQFVGTEFNGGKVSFDGAKFGDSNISFRNTRFVKGKVSFEYAEFGGGILSYENVEICDGNFDFSPNELKSLKVSFENLSLNGNFRFRCKLLNIVSFRGLTVNGIADFSGSSFLEIPDFRDTYFVRPSVVADFAVPPPKLDHKMWKIFQTCQDRDAVYKCRKLKSMAIAAADHEKDCCYFAYEMMAKRGVETTQFFPLLINSLYGWLSNYGQSYLRPMIWLGGCWTLFSCLYFVVIGGALDFKTKVFFAMEQSARSGVPLVNTLIESTPAPQEKFVTKFQSVLNKLPSQNVNVEMLIYFNVVEQFLSAIFLFFLLLALRNTFRLK